MPKIKVVVNGAAGSMGREVIRAVTAEADLMLVGAVDVFHLGEDAGEVAGINSLNLEISSQLDKVLVTRNADVVVDFTTPTAVMENIETSLKHKIRPVVGTTGIVEADLARVKKWVESANRGCIIAPNFAIGAVLMMLMAAKAAAYMERAEIIELHHNYKIDAPSGTAMKTAEMISQVMTEADTAKLQHELEKVPGARGGKYKGINIHSVRLPGLVAHQEVILGGLGQTLSIRHDSLSRTSFMPGVIMAIREVMKENRLIYGLENILKL